MKNRLVQFFFGFFLVLSLAYVVGRVEAQTGPGKLINGQGTKGYSLYEYTEKDGNPGIGVIDGTNKVFTISFNPVSNASVKLYVNGMHERQGTAYTVTNYKTITLTQAPQVGDTIDVDYMSYQ